MKKLIQKMAVVLLICGMIVPGAVSADAAATKEKDSFTITTGDKYFIGDYIYTQIDYLVDGEEQYEDYVLTSSDESIVSVEDYDYYYELKAVGKGKATITASPKNNSKLKASCTIEVVGPAFKLRDQFGITSVTVPLNGIFTCQVGSVGDKATITSADNTIVTANLFSWEYTSVYFRGNKVGKTTITVKGTDGSAKLNVNVVDAIDLFAANQVTYQEYNKKAKTVTEYLQYTLTNQSKNDITIAAKLPDNIKDYSMMQLSGISKDTVLKAGESIEIKSVIWSCSSSEYSKAELKKFPTAKQINMESYTNPNLVVKQNDTYYGVELSYNTGYLADICVLNAK